jgi:dihydropteroate synthase
MSGKESEKLFNNPASASAFLEKKRSLKLRNAIHFLDRPWVMTVLNLTPDSFYTHEPEGQSIENLLKKIELLLPYTDILDIGAVSTRPGAPEVPEEEEARRLFPALMEIRKTFPDLPVSIDTWRSGIAQQAVDLGADMINDVSGGNLDSKMIETIGRLQVPYVVMHMKGNPETMQINPEYQDITKEIMHYFSERLESLSRFHIHDIILDPGFGFGKTVDQNFCLLSELQTLSMAGHPVMVGFSRKSMIQKALHITADESLNGTSILNTIALTKGADILRVHDPKEAMEACLLYSKLHS